MPSHSQNDPHDDRFRPAMPQIPGVGSPPREPLEAKAGEPPLRRGGESDERESRLPLRLLIVIAMAAGFISVLGWWTVHAKREALKTGDVADQAAVEPPSAIDEQAFPSASLQDAASGVTSVATLEELAKPWSAKKFTFENPQTHEHVPAMVVRLPATNGRSKDAYWAFSLNAPYKTCQLDYLENPSEVASRYGYRATHPMVAAGCDGTLYDPLRVGTTPSGAWVRGDIAQGPGIRPPISIEIRVQGDRILADRIE